MVACLPCINITWMKIEILILTGACGVGKTTTARGWAKRRNGAIIECDYLTEWIHKKDFPHWGEEEERFTANLSAKIALEYMAYDMPVAIENVWSPEGIRLLKTGLQAHSGAEIRTVWLYCDARENHLRDEQRAEADQMRERVDIVNKELAGYAWPADVKKIDTTLLSLEQTLDLIDTLWL